jgi:hypothetical protein
MPDDPSVLVRRAVLGDEGEVARFEEAFDDPVLPDETRRFLDDERHHLLLGYERGCVSVWVLTDEDKAAAMRLYRTTGGVW